MPISHPMTKKGAASNSVPQNPINQQAPQTFVVNDPTLDQKLEQFGGEVERPLMPTEEVIQKAKEPPRRPTMNPETIKKLENILFVGRLSKVVEIGEAKFELSTLTNKEQNDIVREMYNFVEGTDLFTIRTLTLGHALRSINGVSLDDMEVFSEEEEEQYAQMLNGSYKRRQSIVDNMQLYVIEKLYDAYNELLKENETLIRKDEIKKS